MKFLGITIIKCTIAFFLLVNTAVACPPDEDKLRPVRESVTKALESACKTISIGSKADMYWIRYTLVPYYISKGFLTKDPPKGLMKDLDKIRQKCHKDTYNYCSELDLKEALDCVKGMAGSLMLKYGATAMSYCPILDKIVEEWAKVHQAKFQSFLTALCKTKGKVC